MEIKVTTRKVLLVVLSIQLALLGSIGLDKIDTSIPLVRQVVGFIYLTFVPGFLLLRTLKIRVSTLETFLFSIGLSLSFVMFTGFTMNNLYPLIGIEKPISEVPLVITISIFVSSLCLVYYLRNKEFSTSFFLNLHDLRFPWVSFSLLFPCLAALGTYLLSFYSNNILLLILLSILSLIPTLVVFTKLPKRIYPLVIWAISISLLLNYALLSTHFILADPMELYAANLTIANNSWDAHIPNNINALLSVTMLCPVISIVSHISPEFVIKIIYPLFFSLVPVGLYLVFKKQTNDKIAFLSTFFLISIPSFPYIAGLLRQEIAEIFLMLILLLIVNRENHFITSNSALSIVFALSLVVSHYAVSYILMFSLIGALILKSLPIFKKKIHTAKFVSPNFCALYLVLLLGWYLYTSSSSVFNTIIGFFNDVRRTVISEFLDPETSTALNILQTRYPLSVSVQKLLIIICVIFIVIGILYALYKLAKHEAIGFSDEYIFLSVTPLIGLIVALLPEFSMILSIERIFHIASLFLSPFCVTGFLILSKTLKSKKKLHTINSIRDADARYLKAASVFLMIFFLFQSGFVSVGILSDYPHTHLVPRDKIAGYVKGEKEAKQWKSRIYGYYLTEQEVSSAKWLSKYKGIRGKIYADTGSCNILGAYGMMYLQDTTRELTIGSKIDEQSYIYLRDLNLKEGIITTRGHYSSIENPQDLSEIKPVLQLKNKIYSNSGSVIYYGD